MFGRYMKPSKWVLQTNGGLAFGKGIGPLGCGVRFINFVAIGYDSQNHISNILKLKMSVSGFQVSAEKSVDVLDEIAKIQVSGILSSEATPVLINEKNGAELKTLDFIGPCSIVSCDVSKISVGTEIKKYGGGTYLFLGQGKIVADMSPNWLENVLAGSNRGTLGGNVVQFNKGEGIFSNARAACSIDINEAGAFAKMETSVALFSGQITVDVEAGGAQNYRGR